MSSSGPSFFLSSGNPEPNPERLRPLTYLSPADARAMGRLPGAAIYGYLPPGEFSVERFRPNPEFLQFVHFVLRVVGPADRPLQLAALQQADGWLYIADLRASPDARGQVPPEDILGGFEVQDGHILPGTYWANPQYRVLTENGLMQLPTTLHDALIRSLKKLKPPAS